MQTLSVLMEELKEDELCYFILKTVGEKTEGREERRERRGLRSVPTTVTYNRGFVFLVFSETMKSPGIPSQFTDKGRELGISPVVSVHSL